MREQLKRDLEKTRDVHRPLPIYYEETREARCEKKPVLETRLLDDMSTLDRWSTSTIYFARRDRDGMRFEEKENLAEIALDSEHVYGESVHSLRFTSPTRLTDLPEKNKWSGGGIQCIPRAMFSVDHEDWSHYNRISCWIYPDMPGFRNVCLRMQFHNDGEHPAPDRYDRVGHHNINLINRQWNHVQVEIPYIWRDQVSGISFDYDMCGSETLATKTACWYISDLRIDRLAEDELDHHTGWEIGKGRIAFSGSGYQTGSQKTALLCDDSARSFRLVEAATGRTVLEKEVRTVETPTGTFQLLDFSEVSDPGEYYLVCGALASRTFPIGDDIWEDSVWKVLNFYLCERCGCYVPGKHSACCRDRFSEHEGKTILANGGWHDAGDMSQNLTNTSESVVAMFTLAKTVEKNSRLHDRLIEEAMWGFEWMIKTRFGDGWRAQAVGGSTWTDGIIGDNDDRFAPAQNSPIENFMAAGAEALAAAELYQTDTDYADYALACAKEDWRCAYRDRESEGFLERSDPARISHDVVMYSCAVWSALDIYQVDGDPYFKEMAIALAKVVMDCQQQEIPDWNIPFTGFFYRDSSKKLIVHYNHRSHEHEPILALSMLCEQFPEHPDWIKWYYAIVLWSEYYKKAVAYNAPYCMSPASIYHVGEAAADPALFIKQQAEAGEETIGMYEQQVKAGVPLGEGYYLRRFPVWFGFRGNNAITLSGGKAAARAGRVRGSYDLAELAQRQQEWIVGKNPFAESVMYGEGYDYCQQYAVFPGEMVGELSVGIETFEDEDRPHWPQVNPCTYKEVWVHVPLRWLWLCADTCGTAAVSGVLKGKGELVFCNPLTNRKYRIESADTGAFSAVLPAGKYEVSYQGVIRKMELVPAKTYTLRFPFAGIDAEAVQTAATVTVTVKTSGAGSTSLEARCENIELCVPECVALGETITLTGRILDEKRPYLAVLLLNGDVENKAEIFGNNGEDQTE